MNRYRFFIFLMIFCFFISHAQDNSLFYDFHEAQMIYAKHILILKSESRKRFTASDTQNVIILNKLESAGGTKAFIDMYTPKCLRFAESYNVCTFLNQLKKYRARLQSPTEMVKEIESELKEVNQNLEEQQKMSPGHPLGKLHRAYRDYLTTLLERAKKT